MFIGNSACGGDQRGQCVPNERYYSERCSNGTIVNKCFVDDYCASVTKGRTNLTGTTWAQHRYSILQHGDSLYITGGGAGPANGTFIGPFTISVTWPQVHMTYTGVIVPARFGRTITWDHPPHNVWVR